MVTFAGPLAGKDLSWFVHVVEPFGQDRIAEVVRHVAAAGNLPEPVAVARRVHGNLPTTYGLLAIEPILPAGLMLNEKPIKLDLLSPWAYKVARVGATI